MGQLLNSNLFSTQGIVAILLLITLSLGCKKEQKTDPDLDGTWNLETIICFCPSAINLNPGESQWTFDTDNNDLTVANTVPLESNMLANGNYSIKVNSTDKTIDSIVSTICDYSLTDNNETLTIGCNVEMDGPRYTLRKVK